MKINTTNGRRVDSLPAPTRTAGATVRSPAVLLPILAKKPHTGISRRYTASKFGPWHDGRTSDDASLFNLAGRIAQNGTPVMDNKVGTLAVYDEFNNPGRKGEKS